MNTAYAQVLAVLDDHPRATRDWLVGVPWFSPPSSLLDSLRAVAARLTHHPYPPAGGEPDFRAAMVDVHSRMGLSIEPGQVVATHGAKGGLLAVLGCLVEPGDEVLHPAPCYPAYPAMVRRFGGTPVAIEQKGGDFCWDERAIDGCITPRTRALVLSSPANPTGATLDSEQARTLVEVCRKRRIRLVCDEAYDAFRDASPSRNHLTAHFDPTLETVVQVRSFSKSHAVCGWRLGYVAADSLLTDRVTAWQSTHLNPPNALAQLSVAGAPEPPESYVEGVARAVRSRLEELASVVTRSGLPAEAPAGGFYIWVDCRRRIEEGSLGGSLELCLDLARRHGVGLWPGEDFLAPGRVRLSAVGHPGVNWRAALERLAHALETPRNGG